MFKIALDGKHFVETKKHDKHLIFSRTELSAIIHNLFSFRMALHMMLYRNVTALIFPDFLRKIFLWMMGICCTLYFFDRYCNICLLYTSPSPRDVEESRMPSSA